MVNERMTNAEEELKKSQRFYRFIGQVNDLVLHAQSMEEIYAGICNISIATGGFEFVWIGVPDIFNKNVNPIFWAGREEGYLESIKTISTDNVPLGRGPTGKAIREGKYYYSNDIANDPAMIPWRGEALKRNFLSSIALPILHQSKTAAVFTIYAGQINFFNEEELQLLVRVAENISFALYSFDLEIKRRLAETQLQKVSQAVMQSTASIVITDVQGNIEFVNPAFSQLTGYTAEEVIGNNPRILKSGHTSPSDYSLMWESILNRKEWKGEFCNRKKSGEVYWESATISPILNTDGAIMNFVAVKENITSRKLTELQLFQAIKELKNKTEALTKSNNELEKFAYVASHDLQEPLRMVTSFLQLFERKYSNLVDEEGEKYIHFAIDGAARMRNLILDLLQYSRAGAGEMQYEEVDMFDIANDVLLLFKDKIEQINAKVIIHPLLKITSTKSSMHQLLQNLLGNALKYYNKDNCVIEIFEESNDRYYQFCVKDNGIGIDTKYANKIFEIFQRLHANNEFSGTGIGLAVCKKIVESQKGTIWVESELGKGSTFKFKIPKV
ncbi:MAG: hypothetical protein RLY16_2244 [Bacteroidota bacterium]